MDMPSAIRSVIEKQDLTSSQMQEVMRLIMTGDATPAQIGGFLVGLRMKGETVDEIAAAAGVMRELVTKVSVDAPFLVDTCGTGGTGAKTFNVSTASAIVVAAAGGKVAKHGNRSITSKSGSADVLEAAGVSLDITPEQVAICVEKIGVGFMFAPKFHAAMKHAIGPRKEMAVRTIFNVLGPLTNPAGATNQVLGVFSKDLVEPMAQVLAKLGSKHVMVVHAVDGLDEITISGETQVAEWVKGEIIYYTLSPLQFGFSLNPLSSIQVDDAKQSLALILSVFSNVESPAKDIVVLNAGAAIYVAGLAEDMEEGVNIAREVIASGAATERLEALVKLTQSF